ncbi:MAG: hypothetical protein ACK6A5_17800 [Flavobacteriales bacterium]
MSVQSTSMMATLFPGDLVLVERWTARRSHTCSCRRWS